MYNISTAFMTAAETIGRKILTKALFNGTTELTGKNIIDMTVTEAVNDSNGISMGATISSKLIMNLKMPDEPLLLNGGFIEPSMSFDGLGAANSILSENGTLIFEHTPDITEDGTLILSDYRIVNGILTGEGEYCPLGKFYITDAVSNDDFQTKFTVTAYDAFSKTEIPYTPNISMPNTAQAILMDIAGQCNFPLSENIIYPEGEFDFYEFTCRQYIGYFAGLLGKNARFDRLGKLVFVWYTDSGYSINSDMQYMSGFKRLTDLDFVVNSITSGTEDNTIVSGTGIGISFENPFMTQDILDTIFENIGTPSYTPAQLKWRGNPAIEAGDIIVADDKDGNSRELYIMEQTIKIGGGLNCEIKCYGDSEASINFDTSPQSKRLQQVYSKLQEAIAEATELLNGSNGGVFEVIDEDGNGINDGWIIHTADGQRFIKANMNGIGITTNGGATYNQAMTVNGINADTITTGQMNAQRITVGDKSLGDVFSVDNDENGHPIVTIGSSESDIKQKQTNDAITFVDGSDSAVAKFSITGAEWTEMQQMKYCGFVWTKSAVTGNVRFTKVGGDS